VNGFRNIDFGSNPGFSFRFIGKSLGKKFISYLNGSNGITADVGETVIAAVVITTLQKQTIRKFIPDFQVNTYRSNGICNWFFIGGF
jgi:hypothetical protein